MFKQCIALVLMSAVHVVISGPPQSIGRPRQKIPSVRVCNRILRSADKCVQNIILVNNVSAIIPKTRFELETVYCEPFDIEFKCIKRFGDRCLQHFSQTLFKSVSGNALRLYKMICGTVEGQTEFLKHAQCLESEDIKVLHRVFERATNYLEYITLQVPANEVIPWTCCAWWSLYEDGVKLLHSMCDSKTGPATADYFMSIVMTLLTDVIDLACGTHKSVSACKSLSPHMMDKYDRLEIGHRNYSILVPVAGILKLIDSDVTIPARN